MSFEIRHLRQFLAVAEELHFTRAAERLHLAQPALSSQIKRLEETVQLRLLHRNTRVVELTPEGEIFAQKARDALAAYDEVLATATLLRKNEAGHITLGINARFRSQLRVDILTSLEQSNARIDVDYVFESSLRLVNSVRTQQLDVALCLTPTQLGDLRSVVVADDPAVVALPIDHPLAARSSVSLSDLRNERWLLPSDRIFGANDAIRQRCELAGFSIKPAEIRSDFDEEFTLVAQGAGIEVVPQGFLRETVADNVVFVPIEGETFPVCLVVHPRNNNPTLGAVMRVVTESYLAQNPPARLPL